MATADDEIVRDLEREIEAYVTLYPNAADSADGIRSWWLDATREAGNEELVQRALVELERRGVVSRTELPDGHVIYRAATR
ncbi:hypothetical protein PTKU64_80260 [Paraburkholderia terrae]|uniref:Uncharacterized protein n=1 Tax=Paraburkholderia terrae TaxID=311230 RepID=A0ABM7U9D4_9BURK|nr:hypothetical protein [Paraburkholderia terrae]BCZ84351.1 hypothetical protein PTKU64_80260 [Paraburkholderia terrae]